MFKIILNPPFSLFIAKVKKIKGLYIFLFEKINYAKVLHPEKRV